MQTKVIKIFMATIAFVALFATSLFLTSCDLFNNANNDSSNSFTLTKDSILESVNLAVNGMSDDVKNEAHVQTLHLEGVPNTLLQRLNDFGNDVINKAVVVKFGTDIVKWKISLDSNKNIVIEYASDPGAEAVDRDMLYTKFVIGGDLAKKEVRSMYVVDIRINQNSTTFSCTKQTFDISIVGGAVDYISTNAEYNEVNAQNPLMADALNFICTSTLEDATYQYNSETNRCDKIQ